MCVASVRSLSHSGLSVAAQGGLGKVGGRVIPSPLFVWCWGWGGRMRNFQGQTSVSGKCGGELFLLGRKWIADWGMFLKGGDP